MASNVRKKKKNGRKIISLFLKKINMQIAALQKLFSLKLLLEVGGLMARLPCTSFHVKTILGSPLVWLQLVILFSLLSQALFTKCCKSSFLGI